MSHPIRVFLADDHALIEAGVKELLGDVPGIRIIGTASSGHQLLKKVLTKEPDVILLDVVMPDFNALDFIRQLRTVKPGDHPYIILVTAVVDGALAHEAQQLGVSYVAKRDKKAMENMVRTIYAVYDGQLIYSEAIKILLQEGNKRPKRPELTDLQQQVLNLMAQRLSAGQIAQRMGRSLDSIYGIQKRLREALGVEYTEHILAQAIALDLVYYQPD